MQNIKMHIIKINYQNNTSIQIIFMVPENFLWPHEIEKKKKKKRKDTAVAVRGTSCDSKFPSDHSKKKTIKIQKYCCLS